MFNPRQYGTTQASAIAKRVHQEDLQPNESANSRRQTLPPKIAPTMPMSMRRGDGYSGTGGPAARGIPGHLRNRSSYVGERSRLSCVQASSSSGSSFKAPSRRNPAAGPEAEHRGATYLLTQRPLMHPRLTNPQFTLPIHYSDGNSSMPRNPHPPKRRKVNNPFSESGHTQEPASPVPSPDGFVRGPPRLGNAKNVFRPLPVTLQYQGTSTPVLRFEEREQGAPPSVALDSVTGRTSLDRSTPASRNPSSVHRQTPTPNPTVRRAVPLPPARLKQEQAGGRLPVVNPSTTSIRPRSSSTYLAARKDAPDSSGAKQQESIEPPVFPVVGTTTSLKDEPKLDSLPSLDLPLPPKPRSCEARFIPAAQVKTEGSNIQYLAADSVGSAKDAKTSPADTLLPPKPCISPKPSRVGITPPDTAKIGSLNVLAPPPPIELPPQPPRASCVRVRSHVARLRRPDAPPIVRPHNIHQPPAKWFPAEGTPILPRAPRPISKPTQMSPDTKSSTVLPLKPAAHRPAPIPAIHIKEKRPHDLPSSPRLHLPPRPSLPVKPAAFPIVRVKEESVGDLPVSTHISLFPRPPQPISCANMDAIATPKVEDVDSDLLPPLSTKLTTPPQLSSVDVKSIPEDTPKPIKQEPPDPAEVIIPQRRLVTESCSFYPIPDNCRKSVPGYKDNRIGFFRKECKRLQSFGLTKQKVIFRDDGLAIEWISPVPVWSDTLLPAPEVRVRGQITVECACCGPLPTPAAPA
ncbi:hypothetical protein P691DRAFT_773365 [Macrolepiota fuliginosa MF-IS2]|uniref:Uncharacterized protein n=1 Tax=Macrolepiota fuliginosa MF-IS2 TaxID=1400762 RepID=A0A9P5XIS6_9AGAR|nr:hypothetical protein P691DRAFT_773365 [Macrolepiota fuliginosa MF-IS2]